MAKIQSKENLLRRMASARHSLLLIMIFTVVNMVMAVLDANTYFLFSLSVPYYLSALGILMDGGAVGTFAVTGLVIGAAILVVYLLCWLLSKKKQGWLTAALVLMVLDTAALALFTFTLFDNPAVNLVDFLLHGWMIWDLVKGVSAAGKLKKLPAEAEQELDLNDFQGTIPDLGENSDEINL